MRMKEERLGAGNLVSLRRQPTRVRTYSICLATVECLSSLVPYAQIRSDAGMEQWLIHPRNRCYSVSRGLDIRHSRSDGQWLTGAT